MDQLIYGGEWRAPSNSPEGENIWSPPRIKANSGTAYSDICPDWAIASVGGHRIIDVIFAR